MKDIIEDAKLDMEEVKNKKLILKGDDIVDGIDYTHFNFLVHTNHDEMSDMLADVDTSAFDVLKLFWKKFYPYLEAEIEDKENLFLKMGATNEDADETVQLGMEFKFRMDHAEDIIRQSGKGLQRAYETRLYKARVQLREEMLKQIEDSKTDPK